MSCECLHIVWNATSESGTSGEGYFQPSGLYNFNSYYEFIIDGTNYFLWYDPNVGGSPFFYIGPILGASSIAYYGGFPSQNACPFGSSWISTKFNYDFITSSCDVPPLCVPIEDRHQRKYDAIQLPEVFEEEDRGFAKCCTKFLVLANGTSKTEENDVSSAWLNLSDPSDTFEFVVVDENDVPTSFQPDAEAFPNEENAYFFTVQWKDILASNGEGCYSIKVTYNIGGVDGFFTWRYYELKFFTVQEALCTARIRVKFNLNQSIEGINFTGSNVEDSIRFNGQIKKDQSNTEIDNLIYDSRRIETVVNENLPTYLIKTDPYTDEVLRLFTDLYLLSANEMFISDYNAHTSSYRIKDIPVTIKDTPERSSADAFSRFETISCTVTNRIANERTYY